MNSYPKIKRSYAVIGHSNHLVEFRQGGLRAQSFYLIDDEDQQPIYDIVSQFKGEKTVQDIVRQLKIDQDSVDRVIQLLKKEQIMEEKPENAFDYYLDMIQPLTDDQHFSVPKKDVLLVGDKSMCLLVQNMLTPLSKQNQFNISYFNQDLVKSFIGHDVDWPDKPLLKAKMATKFKDWKKYFVVFLSRYLNPLLLQSFNRLAHECELTWMNAVIDGPMLLVGPTINNDTACFECFEYRAMNNFHGGEFYQEYKMEMVSDKFQQASNPIIKPIENLLASLVALDVTNYLLTGTNHSVGKCMSMYLPTMETAYHDVFKVSECTTCGVATHPTDNPHFELEHLLQEQDNVVYFNGKSETQPH